MSTYVISDIHGEYETFKAMLERIDFSDRDTLYVLGDVVDRGPEPIKVLKEMMKYPNIIPIVGNHELMALTCLKFLMKNITDENIDLIDEDIVNKLLNWQTNGSESTIAEFAKLTEEEKQDIIEYLEDFSIFEEINVNDKDYLLVHAGLRNFEPDKPIDEYELSELVWERPDYEKKYFDDIIVITGHTPTQYIKCNDRPGYIYKANNHIAIDCGCCFGQRLAAICLDTGEEFYIETKDFE